MLRKKRQTLNKKGQALVELALCGSIILFIFGVLLSYIQRMNDQQYVQMETFRRALEKACTWQGPYYADGAGASVQYTLTQNRRYADLSGEFMKGNLGSTSGNANVLWAIPEIDAEAESDSLMVFRINEDEKTVRFRDYVDKDHDEYDKKGNQRAVYWSLQPGNTESQTNDDFHETMQKGETPEAISVTRSSEFQSTLTNTIPIQVVEKHSSDENYEKVLREEPWTITQNLYRDAAAGGQYKYSTQAPQQPVVRGRIWTTAFQKEGNL